MQTRNDISGAPTPRGGVLLPTSNASSIVLKTAHVHEVCGSATDVFAAVIASQIEGPLVWIGRLNQIASLTPSALLNFFDPTRLVTVACQNRKEILWSAEQALRCGGASGVIIELDTGPNLKESRRFQLAAEAGNALGIILISRSAQSSAAHTRWQCDAISKNENNKQGASWNWQLHKNKSGPVGKWDVRWEAPSTKGGGNAKKGYVHMATATST